MLKGFFSFFCFIFSFMFCMSASAANPAAGQKKSFICTSCHGENGISVISEYPNIAGQKYDYLVSALSAYKSGNRQNDMMNNVVLNLTDQDIADLASYYSRLACR